MQNTLKRSSTIHMTNFKVLPIIPEKENPEKFRCKNCNIALAGKKYLTKDQQIYCESCYDLLNVVICAECDEKIDEEQYISAFEKTFHKNHFSCVGCKASLESIRYYEFKEKPFCENCYKSYAKICWTCKKEILDFLCIDHEGNFRHRSCWKCGICGKQFENNIYTLDPEELNPSVHTHCFKDKHYPKCVYCEDYCSSDYYAIDDDNCIHEHCMVKHERQLAEAKSKTTLNNIDDYEYKIKDPSHSFNNNSETHVPGEEERMCEIDTDLGAEVFVQKPRNSIAQKTMSDPRDSCRVSAYESPALELRFALQLEDRKDQESPIVWPHSYRTSIGPKFISFIEPQRLPDISLDITMDQLTDRKEDSNKIEPKTQNILDEDNFTTYPYRKLIIRPLPADVVLSHKEAHLSNEEFSSIFGMTKEEFSKLTKAKRIENKIKHKLF